MKPVSRQRRAVIATAALSLAMSSWSAFAQGGQQIRMILPNAPGSSVDALARTFSNQLSRTSGDVITVENLPGAGGVTGSLQIVRGAKDGTTLGMVSNNYAVNPTLYKKMPFDSLKDITPISIVASSPFVLVAHPSVPAKDLQDLIALAKAKPDELTFGSSGNGTILHLAGEALQMEAGIKLKHVPYKGTGQLTTDLLGGQIQLAFLGVTGAAQHVRSGKLRAIGVSSKTPSSILPDVPPLAQQGVPNYEMLGWIALIAPAGLPDKVVSKLYADTRTLLANPEMQQALAAQGFTPIGTTPQDTASQFKSDMADYAKLVKASGMSID